MKSKKILALLVTVALIVGVMPFNALAVETDPPAEGEQTQETEGEETSGDTDTEQVPEQTPEQPAGTSSDETTTTTDQTTISVDKDYVSNTNNMIGVVFINTLSGSTSSTDFPNLDKYGWDHKELSDYGNSPRVRFLGDPTDPNANYLVYRDSFLIISEADSANYNVSINGNTATVTPGIASDQLTGKTGIIFLADKIGNDTILVFAEGTTPSPDASGNLVVTLEDENNISVNQLFSDGKLGFSATGSVGSGVGHSIPGVDWNEDISGTNWSGTITDFAVDDISAGLDFDVFSGFEINFNFDFTIDFDITTTGSSGGKQTAQVAKITIPIDIFTAIYTFDVVVDFDDTPINVKGDLNTNFNYGITVNGANINSFKTPVNISELNITNPEDYNKDIDFYIGAQLNSSLAIIYVEISFMGWTYTFGPVFSLNFLGYGGRYFTANFAKDQYDTPDQSMDKIHICAHNGEDGCLHLSYEEKQGFNISATINLFIKTIPINFYSDEETVDSGELHNSYTYGGGWQSGACENYGYRIDVTVNDNLNVSTKGATVTYTPVASYFDPYASAVVDASNKAVLFAPANQQIQVTAEITSPHDSAWKISQTLTLDKNADVQALNFMLEVPEKHVYFKNTESGTPTVWPADITFAPFYTEYVKLPNNMPELSGRQFLGWNTAEDGSGKYYSPGCVITLSEDTTLYAQWDKAENSWYVIYNANGGQSAPGPQIGTKGDNITLTSTLPNPGGLVFKGWALSANASAPDYQPGDTIPYDSSKTVVILYAIWELDPAQRPVVITFDANGGHADSLPHNISIPVNAWSVLPDVNPVWDLSHKFLGWSDDPNATEARWAPGDVVYFDGDVTLYAVWEVLPTPSPAPSPAPEPPAPIPVPASGEGLSPYSLAGLILVALGGASIFIYKKFFAEE